MSQVACIVKPHANRHNVVGQQLPTLLDVTCCIRLHTLLLVVGSCWAKLETGQTFSYMQTDRRNNSQQFWKLFANNVASVCKGLKLSSDNRNFSHFWLCKFKFNRVDIKINSLQPKTFCPRVYSNSLVQHKSQVTWGRHVQFLELK